MNDFSDWHWATVIVRTNYNAKTKVAAWGMYVNGEWSGKHQYAAVFKGRYEQGSDTLLEFQAIVNALLIMHKDFKEVNCLRITTSSQGAANMIDSNVCYVGCDKPFGVYKNMMLKFRCIKIVPVTTDTQKYLSNKIEKVAREVRQNHEQEFQTNKNL